jgi:hypothetical protein
MRILIISSLTLSGCLPCLSTPDCLTEHTIRLTQGNMPVSSFQVELKTTYDDLETWQCPSEDNRCEENGKTKSYSDGVLTITLDDGQMITKTLQSGPTERCGCPEVNDVSIQFE